MKICTAAADLQNELGLTPCTSVGFVPTMGCLHEGHLSLVRASRAENGRTVASIFVNPAQFGPAEDFQRYPRQPERDAAMLEKEGVDCLFLPEAAAVYPDGYDTWVEVENLSRPLCGRSRPGHFRGVATVVLKLFHIVRPDRAYFGQKDAQQAIVINRMISDLHLPIRLRVLPIVRDSDGLALSSRNVYLSPEERRASLRLPQALQAASVEIGSGQGDAAAIAGLIRETLGHEKLIEPEYIEVVSLDRLQPLARIAPGNTLIACAIRVGRTRLIDNIVLGSI